MAINWFVQGCEGKLIFLFFLFLFLQSHDPAQCIIHTYMHTCGLLPNMSIISLFLIVFFYYFYFKHLTQMLLPIWCWWVTLNGVPVVITGHLQGKYVLYHLNPIPSSINSSQVSAHPRYWNQSCEGSMQDQVEAPGLELKFCHLKPKPPRGDLWPGLLRGSRLFMANEAVCRKTEPHLFSVPSESSEMNLGGSQGCMSIFLEMKLPLQRSQEKHLD